MNFDHWVFGCCVLFSQNEHKTCTVCCSHFGIGMGARGMKRGLIFKVPVFPLPFCLFCLPFSPSVFNFLYRNMKKEDSFLSTMIKIKLQIDICELWLNFRLHWLPWVSHFWFPNMLQNLDPPLLSVSLCVVRLCRMFSLQSSSLRLTLLPPYRH